MIVCRQDSAGTANTDGEIPEAEEEVCRRRAKQTPIRGKDRDVNDQMQADVTHLVTLRYCTITAAIDYTYWIKIVETDERLNVVRAYDPTGERREVELECVQRV